MEQLPLRYRRRFISSSPTLPKCKGRPNRSTCPNRYRRRFILSSTAPIRPQLDSEAKIGMLPEGRPCINLGELAQAAGLHLINSIEF